MGPRDWPLGAGRRGGIPENATDLDAESSPGTGGLRVAPRI